MKPERYPCGACQGGGCEHCEDRGYVEVGASEVASQRYFPKTYHPRQGLRVKDTWGPCKECGYPGAFKCHRCQAWRCGVCIRFRRARGSEPGVYHANCFPRCRKRMDSDVAEQVKRATRK